MNKFLILIMLGLSLTGCVTNVRKSIDTPLGEVKAVGWKNGGVLSVGGVTFSR